MGVQDSLLLLDNHFVFQEFWAFQGGALAEEDWKKSFAAANRAAHLVLGRRDTPAVLSIVLSRIYTLRNQLIHGGATWGSSVNRDQVRDCVNLMAQLVPLIIEIMMAVPPAARWSESQSKGDVAPNRRRPQAKPPRARPPNLRG